MCFCGVTKYIYSTSEVLIFGKKEKRKKKKEIKKNAFYAEVFFFFNVDVLCQKRSVRASYSVGAALRATSFTSHCESHREQS